MPGGMHDQGLHVELEALGAALEAVEALIPPLLHAIKAAVHLLPKIGDIPYRGLQEPFHRLGEALFEGSNRLGEILLGDWLMVRRHTIIFIISQWQRQTRSPVVVSVPAR